MPRNVAMFHPIHSDRRSFLTSGMTGAVLAALPSANAHAESGDQDGPSPSNSMAFELSELSIADLQKRLETGEFTTRLLVEKYRAQIDAIDRQGPELRSVIEMNPDAEALADQLDRERQMKGPRGPLHGIPILIKDNMDTADNMATTAGSLALVDARPPEDSFVVKQLRKAGALVLGKTNLSEWSNIRSNRSTSGWSARGGLTRNPHVLDRNPCGSSSGSAAAVAASLCAAAVGTETDGSIVCPSSACGVVGFKPTVGLIGRTGIIPISHSQDTAGPIARTVRDAAILLGALAGRDPQDPATAKNGGHVYADYTKCLNPAGLQGATIGVARNFFDFHDGVERVMAAALDAMRQAGAVLVDTEDLAIVGESGDSETTVLQYELKADMASYLARLGPGAPVKSLQDIIDFNDRHRQAEMAYFGQDFFVASGERGPLTEYEYVEALARCRRFSRTEGIDAVMDKHKLDALVAPTIGPACVSDLVNGDSWLGGSSSPAAVAGYPSVTVPAGDVFGLPVGVSFFGRAWSECTLLTIAHAFETHTRFRKPPAFRATADLRT